MESGVAATADIKRWAATCFFAEGQTSSKEQIQGLCIQEASEAARDDYGVESAKIWAGDTSSRKNIHAVTSVF